MRVVGGDARAAESIRVAGAMRAAESTRVAGARRARIAWWMHRRDPVPYRSQSRLYPARADGLRGQQASRRDFNHSRFPGRLPT